MKMTLNKKIETRNGVAAAASVVLTPKMLAKQTKPSTGLNRFQIYSYIQCDGQSISRDVLYLHFTLCIKENNYFV